jgi:hypothetical protein
MGKVAMRAQTRASTNPQKAPAPLPPHPFWKSMKDGKCARIKLVTGELVRCGLPENDPIHVDEEEGA